MSNAQDTPHRLRQHAGEERAAHSLETPASPPGPGDPGHAPLSAWATVEPALLVTAEAPTVRMYAELRYAYDFFNQRLFNGALPGCMLTLQREKRSVGYFSANRFGNTEGKTVDEIALNPEWFAVTPIVETLQTIAHEMAHQWQAHFGKPARGRYHNTEWADKMESIGLQPFGPDGKRIGDAIGDKPIRGGRFLEAVDELVSKQGFGLTWYDRVTPIGAHAADALRVERELAGTPVSALAVAAANGVEIQVRPQPTQNADSSSQAAADDPNDVKPGERVKYQCSGASEECVERRTTVWGRPTLRIKCMACGAQLQAVRSKSRQRRGDWRTSQ
jgi:predicted SprT family Zn-dependent metalloprotease